MVEKKYVSRFEAYKSSFVRRMWNSAEFMRPSALREAVGIKSPIHFSMYYLRPLMEKVAAGRAAILDPSDAVARQARRVLESRGLLAPASNEAVHEFIRHQVEFAENPSRKLT